MNAREDWLEQRRTGIGGSDVAALLGVSPYKTPFELWLDKTKRQAEAFSPEQAERMHFGNVLEDVVAREFAAREGVQVQRVNKSLQHPDVAIARANLDRAIVLPGSRARWDDREGRLLGAAGLLECKTAHGLAENSADWGDAGTEEVPEHYWLQVQWYLGIARQAEAKLAVLFGGQRFKVYTIAADQPFFEQLLTEADRWWRDHVVADMPPAPTTELEARQQWASHAAGKVIEVSAEVAAAVSDLRSVKAEIKALEGREQELKNVVCTAFGDAEEMRHAGRRLATWKKNKDGEKTDWEALARSFNPSEEAVAAATNPTTGARTLRLTAPKE